MRAAVLSWLLWLGAMMLPVILSFVVSSTTNKKVVSMPTTTRRQRCVPLNVTGGGSSSSSGTSTIPKNPMDRDKQAIQAIKAAIQTPKTRAFPLIECEFPPLAELNKLGDGSLRSSIQVDNANLEFCAKLVRGLSPPPLPFVTGPKLWFLTSTSSSSNFMAKAKQLVKGATTCIASLKDGIPQGIGPKDICLVVSPSSRQDYQFAKQMATSSAAVVLVNGLAKDQESVGGDATMAYFLKPLTYNSQIVGYLVRKYPNDWATIDLFSNQVLGTYKDNEILFRQTNTPDLRDPGRLIQYSVDQRAIRARIN